MIDYIIIICAGVCVPLVNVTEQQSNTNNIIDSNRVHNVLCIDLYLFGFTMILQQSIIGFPDQDKHR